MAVLTVHQNPVETQHLHRYTEDIVGDGQHHICNFFLANDLLFTQSFAPRLSSPTRGLPLKNIGAADLKDNVGLIQPIISTRLPVLDPVNPFLKWAPNKPVLLVRIATPQFFLQLHQIFTFRCRICKHPFGERLMSHIS